MFSIKEQSAFHGVACGQQIQLKSTASLPLLLLAAPSFVWWFSGVTTHFAKDARAAHTSHNKSTPTCKIFHFFAYIEMFVIER